MGPKELEELTGEVRAIAQRASLYILHEFETFSKDNIEYKSPHDLVSYVDREAEDIIVKGLSSLVPGAGFITEEDPGRIRKKNFNWVVDPLDGTTNFVHGLPLFCVSIGLIQEKEVLAGVVHEAGRSESFYAWKKGGAFLNGKKIHVSKTADLSGSLFATGFPTRNYPKMEEILSVFSYCIEQTRGIRRLGSAAADLAYVACGRLDGFYEYALQPWDVSAGSLLVQEAGGKVGDFSGGGDFLFGKEMVATNSEVFEPFLEILARKMSGKFKG